MKTREKQILQRISNRLCVAAASSSFSHQLSLPIAHTTNTIHCSLLVMATRKKSKEFQEFFTNYESWEAALVDSRDNKTLLIVDVHSTWCGACQAIVETFKRIYLEKAEDYPMRFCVLDSELVLKSLEEAHADEQNVRDSYVNILQPIAGKSQPHFLFFLSGQLRKTVTGVNTPIIQKTVDRLLADIDEGNNTGKEDMLDTDEDEAEPVKKEAEEAATTSQQPAAEQTNATATQEASPSAATGTESANDEQFFEDKTTEQSPPASARSSLSQQSQKAVDMVPLKVFVSSEGANRVYAVGDVDAPEGYTEDVTVGYIPSASSEENSSLFRKTLYSFQNKDTKHSVLVSAPDAIQKYVQDDAWIEQGHLGYLFAEEGSGLVGLHELTKDGVSVYASAGDSVEKLKSEGYTDNGPLGSISTNAAYNIEGESSRVDSQPPSQAATPRGGPSAEGATAEGPETGAPIPKDEEEENRAEAAAAEAGDPLRATEAVDSESAETTKEEDVNDAKEDDNTAKVTPPEAEAVQKNEDTTEESQAAETTTEQTGGEAAAEDTEATTTTSQEPQAEQTAE